MYRKIIQELANLNEIKSVYYPTNEFKSEVDFVINYKSKIIPIEAKAGINVKAKSLRNFMNEYDTLLAIRYSLLNLTLDEKIFNIPLYTIWNTINYLKNI